MSIRTTQLRSREVVCTADGSRLGFVEDVEIDLKSGKALALLVPSRTRFPGLPGRRGLLAVPWESILCFGDELILVGELSPVPTEPFL